MKNNRAPLYFHCCIVALCYHSPRNRTFKNFILNQPIRKVVRFTLQTAKARHSYSNINPQSFVQSVSYSQRNLPHNYVKEYWLTSVKDSTENPADTKYNKSDGFKALYYIQFLNNLKEMVIFNLRTSSCCTFFFSRSIFRIFHLTIYCIMH